MLPVLRGMPPELMGDEAGINPVVNKAVLVGMASPVRYTVTVMVGTVTVAVDVTSWSP